jgi:hypothetical protein
LHRASAALPGYAGPVVVELTDHGHQRIEPPSADEIVGADEVKALGVKPSV